MNTVQAAAVHGRVYPVAKADYAREVTAASAAHPVLLHLASGSHGNVESRLLSELFRQAAAKYPEVKFCECVAQMCIENYPEKNCPTILVYKNGDLAKNLIKLDEMRGQETRLPHLEAWMVAQGVIAQNDMRRRNRDEEATEREERNAMGMGIRSGKKDRGDSDDDDWE